MKRIAVCAVALLCSCGGGQPKPADLILNDEFEWFDQERFDKRPDKNDVVLREYLPNGTRIELQEFSADSMLKTLNEHKYYFEIPKDSYFMLEKVYYPSGRIQAKGWEYIDFFKKGVWYEFDEDGNLTATVDYDKPFTYTFKNVLKFCKRHNIKVERGNTGEEMGGPTTRIGREVDGDKSVWYIQYSKSRDLLETIDLDGKTGKVISRESVELIQE